MNIVIRIQRVNVPILLFIPFTQYFNGSCVCLSASLDFFECLHLFDMWNSVFLLHRKLEHVKHVNCVNGINSKMGTLTLWMRITMCTRHSGNSNTESIRECHGITGMSGKFGTWPSLPPPRGRPGNEVKR